MMLSELAKWDRVWFRGADYELYEGLIVAWSYEHALVYVPKTKERRVVRISQMMSKQP